jgi:hypothetical protein
LELGAVAESFSKIARQHEGNYLMVGRPEYQVDNSTPCRAGAFVLCFLHILTVAGMAYQGRIHLYLANDDHDLLINYGIWLSPALTILIFRRSCPLVGLYAGPVLIDFAARAYFAWDYYSTGVNSIRQKGDWATWLTTFMGIASIGILACWLVFTAGVLLVHLINRLRQLRGG